jgi:hypothetical protein
MHEFFFRNDVSWFSQEDGQNIESFGWKGNYLVIPQKHTSGQVGPERPEFHYVLHFHTKERLENELIMN